MPTPSIAKPWLKSYEAHVPETVDLATYESIPHVLESSFQRFRDKPAFHNMGKTITYGDLDRLTKTFADYLQNVLKLPRGAKIALMMPNILQYPIALFGALRGGFIVVNVNPLYTPRELEHQLNDSEAVAIVIFENACVTLEKILAKTKVKHVITTRSGTCWRSQNLSS